jgi:hypothetical protein
LENPTWKHYYEGAPTEALKAYIALDFYASETESEEAFDRLDGMLKKLNHEEVQYLYDRAIGPEKAKFAKILSNV